MGSFFFLDLRSSLSENEAFFLELHVFRNDFVHLVTHIEDGHFVLVVLFLQIMKPGFEIAKLIVDDRRSVLCSRLELLFEFEYLELEFPVVEGQSLQLQTKEKPDDVAWCLVMLFFLVGGLVWLVERGQDVAGEHVTERLFGRRCQDGSFTRRFFLDLRVLLMAFLHLLYELY